jgi:hypothetical protein
MMLIRATLCVMTAALLSCGSTMPTATQLDELESQVRREQEPEYARLSQMRAAGQLTPGEYDVQKDSLDLKVQNKVDNMVWSRHALAQSHLKSIGMPTPDLPIANLPPGVGSVQGSLYNSQRLNGLGNQMQANFMQNAGTSSFQKGSSAGTVYDQP